MTWANGKITNVNRKQANATQLLSGKWQLYFDEQWGGPKQVEVDTLKSWVLFEDKGIKYYSGTAVYKKSFSVRPENLKATRVILNLGNVLEMASITINGNKMPVKWSAPFQFDITGFVKPGNNQLEVEVVNLWPNRLIGDSKLPVEKRLTKTNIMKYDAADSEKYLRQSGLIGPVKLLFIHTEN